MLRMLKKGIAYISFIGCLTIFVVQPKTTSAVTAGVPFGGRIYLSHLCPCSANIMLYILNPYGVTVPLVYQPGVSLLFAKYKPVMGSAVLGTFVPGGVCLSYYYCAPMGLPIGTVFMMGTS